MHHSIFTAISMRALGALIAVSPLVAAQAYVSITGPSSVSAINRANPWASKTLIAGKGAVAVALTPDGKRAYVANELGRSISVLDTTTGQPMANILLTADAYAVVASPDGSRIYALTQDSYGGVAVLGIDTASNRILFSNGVPGSYGGWSRSLPHMPAPSISADGQTLYIATSSLTLFDVTTQTVTATIQTPHGYIGLVGWRSIRMARKLL